MGMNVYDWHVDVTVKKLLFLLMILPKGEGIKIALYFCHVQAKTAKALGPTVITGVKAANVR
jgi:hypothetical protein